ncbi:MAG: protein kinase [Anaerolineae bacterium]|nr:protein kinase [Anaerolineae bacterium]
MQKLLDQRYRLEGQIGGGGMGNIYRAFDRLTQRHVALKRVALNQSTSPEDTPSLGLRRAITHEFQVLASLRHPHIIRVLNYGFDLSGTPYFTMELLENAQTLLHYGQSRALTEKVELLIQLLQALSYVHRRDLLHRDLKPSNVLVVNGQLKLVDFGLAAQQQENMVGTLAYIAPETLQGGISSPASDLYSVGIMAYELFTGRYPFELHNMTQLIADVLMRDPDIDILRSALSESIDPYVEIELPNRLRIADIIALLTAKSPEWRYSHAEQVIADLQEAIHAVVLTETDETRDSFLQAAEFIGREYELTHLIHAVHQLLDGQGSAWVITGESGIGKTRLLNEVRTYALTQGALVVSGTAAQQNDPYALWRDPITRLVLNVPLSDAEAACLQGIAPGIERLLERRLPPIADCPPLGQVITDIVIRQPSPVVIIMEDLHQAASESLALIAHLLDHIDQTRVLLLLSYRSDEIAPLFPELPHLHLQRFNSDEIAILSRSMLGVFGERPDLLQLLEQETEGNPFFMVEIVRVLAQTAGYLSKIATLDRLPDEIIAGGVVWLIQKRLDRVPRRFYPLLQVAAILGRQIDLEVLQAVDPTVEIDRWLDACIDAAVIEWREGGWYFTHDKLRQSVMSTNNQHQVADLHRQAAIALARVYGDHPAIVYHRQHARWLREQDYREGA